MKKFLSALLALCMVFGLCITANASSEEPASSDEYAALSLADAQWSYDEANDAWSLTGVSYCLNPVSEVQTMNIYVPGAYLDENGEQTLQVVNGYNAETAPVLLINDIGGYAQSTASGISSFTDYLANGYVVVSPGTRGRDTVDADGNLIGSYEAGLIDLKSAVRCLKYNDAVLPGSSETIVSRGRSAGGAMSMLLGTTGNNAAYDEALEEAGAVMTATDDIYAVQAYCPISDLEHENAAYEWFYNDNTVYGSSAASGEPLSAFSEALGDDLADAFMAYVNTLGLEDADGNELTLTGLREGSYYDYVVSVLEDSLADYLTETYSVVVSGMSAYTYLDEDAVQAYVDELNADEEWVSVEYSYAKASTGPSTIVTYASGVTVTITSLAAFTEHMHTRLSAAPAFDDAAYSDACTILFANDNGEAQHYDVTLQTLLADNDYSALDGYDEAYASDYTTAEQISDSVALLNPLTMMDGSDVAPYFRIRTGTNDQFASIAETVDQAAYVDTYSDASVDFALAWAQPHGDAEINTDDFIAWVERVCKFEKQHTEQEIADLLNLDNMEYTWTLSGDGDAACYILSPIVEVANPELPDYQGLSVAIPAYYVKQVNEDGSLEFDYDYEFENPNGVTYTAATAPIIINTGAAGYSAGTTSKASASYVSYGYINVACGNRGKSLTAIDACGNQYYCGDAPYCLVDQKSCVRWLKYNIALGNICGDADRMVSTGGSGGGAHSLMLAATGNNPDFYPYLEESGAVMSYDGIEISDAIWGCCPYSAITNLQEANMAYEFESALGNGNSVTNGFSEFRTILSAGLAEEYMNYINDRGLTYDIDGDGEREALTIEYDETTGTYGGTYVEFMELVAEEQLDWYVNNIPDDEYDWIYSFDGELNGEAYLLGDYDAGGSASGETGVSASDEAAVGGYAATADDTAVYGTGEDLTTWVSYTVEDGVISVDFDLADFLAYRGRSKTNPSFDDLDLGQAENQEFGDEDQDFKHWDEHVLAVFDKYYDELDAAYDGTDSEYATFADMYAAYKADIESTAAGDKFGQNKVYLYNPLNYILDDETELPAWTRVVHGTADTDSSVLISMNDGVAFDMVGVNSFFAWSWDEHHVAGDPVGTSLPGYVDSMVEAGY